jgi:peptide-methionine (S)-S-oxide reductase
MCNARAQLCRYRATNLSLGETLMRRFAALLIGTVCALTPFAVRAEPAVVIPPPALDETAPGSALETAVLAGGCFWGMQAVYQHVKGVTNAISGYTGGAKKTAEYEIVSSGTTGHAESVEVTFNPRQISYGKILQIYFSVAHNPTELNRQGPDYGTQYRSEIFPQSTEQQKIARHYISQLDQAHVFKRPIVTKTDALKAAFYPAEGYHQDYAIKHPYQPYIVYNDAPKVENLKKLFPDVWREKAVTVAEAEKRH